MADRSTSPTSCLLALLEVRLATARAVVERIARVTGEFYEDDARAPEPTSEHHHLMREFQAAKLVANRAAIDVVDQAVTLGGGYAARSTLARLYRDVRAAPFMQAYSPNEAHEYIGKVALGLEPILED